MHSLEQQVRERAYHIWISAGMADGMAHEHWASAERAIMSERARPTKAAKTKKATAKATVARTGKTASAKTSLVKTPPLTIKVAKRKSSAADERAHTMSAG